MNAQLAAGIDGNQAAFIVGVVLIGVGQARGYGRGGLLPWATGRSGGPWGAGR